MGLSPVLEARGLQLQEVFKQSFAFDREDGFRVELDPVNRELFVP
jgi:hypothetical protein